MSSPSLAFNKGQNRDVSLLYFYYYAFTQVLKATNAPKSEIIELCQDIRHVIIGAQIFVNYFILTHTNSSNDKLTNVFKQNFWYFICQLVMGKKNVMCFLRTLSNRSLASKVDLTIWRTPSSWSVVTPKVCRPQLLTKLWSWRPSCKSIETFLL